MSTYPLRRDSLQGLKRLLKEKWPEACGPDVTASPALLNTGIEAFDSLFREGGLPYGQLLEITGADGSGKTRLLFFLLAALTRADRAVYLDFGRSFFPVAAAAAGVDLCQLLIARPGDLASGIRTAEQLLEQRLAASVVFDLVGETGRLPQVLLHRLRQQTVRTNAFVIFLTDVGSAIIGSSLVSLRLEVRRKSGARLEVVVARSRISCAGSYAEFKPDA